MKRPPAPPSRAAGGAGAARRPGPAGPGPEVSLRPATAEDAEFLFQVYASSRAEELAPVPWSDAEKEVFLRQQFAAQATHYQGYYPRPEFLVVLRAGQPAGRLYLHRTADALAIMDIALLPEHRGAGIGSRLLADLVAEADAAGKLMRLHVEHDNPARRLYDRLGFTVVGDTGFYCRMERPPRSQRA